MLAHGTCSQAPYTALMCRYVPFQMFQDFYQHAAKPGMPKWPYTAAHHNLVLLISRWFQLYIWSFTRILNDFFSKLKTHTFSCARYRSTLGTMILVSIQPHSVSQYFIGFHMISKWALNSSMARVRAMSTSSTVPKCAIYVPVTVVLLIIPNLVF
jgi:hypothetical protein